MEFQVPQFIEIEDKIFGPLTFKQFIYLAGGAGISFVLWTFLPSFLAILFIIPVVAFVVALAFYRLNDKPFISVVESAIAYATGCKLYIWKRRKRDSVNKDKRSEAERPDLRVPRLSDSKLKDIAWSLDVHKELR